MAETCRWERLGELDLQVLLWDDFGWSGDIGVLAILDGAGLLDDEGDVRIEAIRRRIEARLHLVPRFRQRLYRPPRGLGWPLWVDSASFDLAEHVRVQPLAAPADQAQLLLAYEELARRRLDPARPLWEMWLLPGLPQRGVGLFVKLHHTIADGVAGVATLGALLDLTADAAGPVAPPWTPAPVPTAGELLQDNLCRRVQGLHQDLVHQDPVHQDPGASGPGVPATGGLNPRHPRHPAPLAGSRTHSGSAVEVNLCTPIAVAVQGWCGDAVGVVAVDGEVDADSCAALATAVAQAARTYRAVIIDLTRVRALSAAGLHCLDCVGPVQDERQGVVHLVCAESSAVRGVLQQVQLRHRWPVHPDLAAAVGQVMRPLADPPEPTGALPRTTRSGIGTRSVVRPDSRLASPVQTRSPARRQGPFARPPLGGVIEPTTYRTQHLALNETRRHEDTQTRRGSWV